MNPGLINLMAKEKRVISSAKCLASGADPEILKNGGTNLVKAGIIYCYTSMIILSKRRR